MLVQVSLDLLGMSSSHFPEIVATPTVCGHTYMGVAESFGTTPILVIS